MNKQDLISAIAEQTTLTKEVSKNVIEAIVSTISEALKNGEKVQLTGFGSWETKVREARKGRNPKTGEEIQIDQKTVVKFKPSKGIID